MLAVLTTLVPSPLAHFRALLHLGYMVHTMLHVEGGNWRTVSATLGLHRAQKSANVGRALVLFCDLLCKCKMYKLRHLQPKGKSLIFALEKHSDDILAWLDDHPDELLWWSDNDQDPPVIVVRNHKGEDVNWIDWRWL